MNLLACQAHAGVGPPVVEVMVSMLKALQEVFLLPWMQNALCSQALQAFLVNLTLSQINCLLQPGSQREVVGASGRAWRMLGARQGKLCKGCLTSSLPQPPPPGEPQTQGVCWSGGIWKLCRL